MNNKIALIGFGEAGATFAQAARWSGCAFDILPSRAEAMADAGSNCSATAADALKDADIVLSLVTADSALKVASEYARYLRAGAIWCDMNSVAPDTKREASLAVEAAGARYADIAVLAPVNPAKLSVPLLVSGPCAAEAVAALETSGFTDVRSVGSEVGRASAIKMIRSVMVKGLEALTDEMMQAARAAGVVDEVLTSLDKSERSARWSERAEYNLERMATHGLRRAAEMEEVAKTLASLGVEPLLTSATVTRQREAATRHAQVGSKE